MGKGGGGEMKVEMLEGESSKQGGEGRLRLKEVQGKESDAVDPSEGMEGKQDLQINISLILHGSIICKL